MYLRDKKVDANIYFSGLRTVHSIDEKLNLLREVSNSYRKLWAAFDMPLIILGIASMINAVLLHACFIHYRLKTKLEETFIAQREVYQNGAIGHSNLNISGDAKSSKSSSNNAINLANCLVALSVAVFATVHYPPHIACLFAPLAFLQLHLL